MRGRAAIHDRVELWEGLAKVGTKGGSARGPCLGAIDFALARSYLKGPQAQVAELVDALASGASARKGVEVRVFSWAPIVRYKRPLEDAPSLSQPPTVAQ